MCSGFLQQCLKYFFSIALCFQALLMPSVATAQEQKVRNKLSPELDGDIRKGKQEGTIQVRIYFGKRDLQDSLKLVPYHPRVISVSRPYTVLQMELSAAAILRVIVPMENVVFIEKVRKPVPELVVGSMDLSLNGVRLAQERFPGQRGDDRVVSVKEDKPDTTDLDILGRNVPSDFSSGLVSDHATLMSTIIAGAGNSWHLGRGVAPAAAISSADFSSLLPEPDGYYVSGGIRVQNHSYGVGIESFYGADAAMYDASANSVPGLLHVFSAGNRGNGAAATGPYQGLAGFANLTGSFKMAKNTLSVGAVDSFLQVEALSSRGPAHDGRVKPELVAFGEDGSSGAAALVSGAALLVQQAYRQKHGGEAPGALVRAILVNSADDLGTPAVDYIYGFGNLNAYQAMKTVEGGRHVSGTLQSNAETITEITVPNDIARLKITLAWNDLPATPNADRALINDLDLQVRKKSTGETWLPWVLSPFPHADSLRRPAIRGRDSLNNLEQVTIELPDGGEYEIRVRSGTLADAQEYQLVWQLDTAGFFEWLYPLRQDPLEAGGSNLLRWKTNSQSKTGSLEYSRDDGNSWTLIRQGIDLSAGHFRWLSPSVMGPVMLRISDGARVYASDTVVLSGLIEPVVGFSCEDSFYLHWNAFPGAQAYRIFAMGPQYLEEVQLATDTMAVLANSNFPGNYVAVEPVFEGLAGQRSYTFNHATQGAGCYIQSFRGELENQTAKLYLSMGTQYQVQRIVLEKWNGAEFQPIAERLSSDSLEFLFEDKRVVNGVNRYRVRVDITGSRKVYSLTEDLFFTGSEGYRLFPNLVRRGEPMNLALENIVDDGTIQVFDMQGRLLMQDIIRSSPQQIPTHYLVPGIYLVRVVREGRIEWTGKCAVF